MQVFTSINELSRLLDQLRGKGRRIGFVPTMGALHEGHLSLIDMAFRKTDLVVISIFVNPTQFNNPEDLANYPRMIEADLQALKDFSNLVVYHPAVNEVYPENDSFSPIDLGGMDEVMEGKFRPGHFKGVVHVVHNLFRMIQPTDAFFGLKDFQQVAIIRHMTSTFRLPIEIHACPTIRNADGLALSSRNMLLNEEQRNQALILFQVLTFVRKNKNNYTPQEIKGVAIECFHQGSLELEYLEIADAVSLQPLTNSWADESVCCIAAFCGEVRLIDNMLID
jgi:pantoate--beta-alanine ligase